jgi:non-specific serine/threonine protein kinase
MAAITARREDSRTGPPSFAGAFVGRRTESARLRRLVAQNRLVTVTGPAGAGKSRLAAEVAGRIRSLFADDVCWVDLSEILGDDQVAEAVHARFPATGPESLLLVLDNGDRVLDGCRPVIEEILRRCPAVRLLLISRTAVRLAEEQILPLAGLQLPEPATASADRLRRADAVRLLTERIRRADPGFTVTAAIAADVAAICARLESLPLALELAAPSVRRLGPAELLRRIGDGLDLTSEHVRTSPPWHTGVRASVAWSQQALSSTEIQVWQRLSVLAGPFDAELATAVCALDPDVVLATLGELEARSLLTRVTGEDGSVALRHWNAGRAFAAERLAAAGETGPAYERLVAHLVAEVAPRLEDFLVPAELCQQIVARAGHLLAAIDWLSERDDDRIAVLACGLARSWMALGRHLAESERLLRDALPRVRHRPDLTASLLAALCKATHRHGRYAEALRIGAAALDLERTLARPHRIASILDLLAAAHRAAGDIPQASSTYRQAMDLARTLDDPAVLSLLFNDIAWAALEWGDSRLAREVLTEGLPLARAHATPGRLASILHTAGAAALAVGDYRGAEAHFIEAMMATNPADGLKVPYFAEGIGLVLAATGDGERALSLFACAENIRRALHAAAEPAWSRRVRQAAADAAAELGSRRAGAAAAAGSRIGLDGAVDYALNASEHFHAAGREPLTHQEHAVAALVADGLTNQQIARRLGISPRTVATHLERIRAKLGVGPRPALAAWFTRADRGS